MSEDKKKHIKIEDGNTEAEEAKAEEVPVEEKEPEEAEEKAPADETPEKEPDGTEAESERYIRLMAEFQNYKKRAAKEKADIHAYANEKIMGELLPVLDNFERALETETDDLEGYVKGMQLIFGQFRKVLEDAGLEEIKAMDEVFDPNLHNAVLAENVEDKEDGVITKVLQKGYKLRDKVIRPSMVAVNKK